MRRGGLCCHRGKNEGYLSLKRIRQNEFPGCMLNNEKISQNIYYYLKQKIRLIDVSASLLSGLLYCTVYRTFPPNQ